jgi:cellulose synthase/poly-beta-1,6-N-acetylglucosamine synthase-like glycosyltransferase
MHLESMTLLPEIFTLWIFMSAAFLFLFFRLSVSLGQARRACPKSTLEYDPTVCIQLPIYNEGKQAIGLIKSVAQLKWPRKKLEVQILDDSTDETPELVKDLLKTLSVQNPDLQISHIIRNSRYGYKAGAMNAGLRKTSAEFIAVFDADFRPESDFLTRLIPQIANQKSAAAIQAPWAFRNTQFSWLTRFQTMLLNVHFHIEHAGRAMKDLAFNFNGTAGIWRRSVLDDLGGWSSSTVCEDLHLSFKAQLRGYKILFDREYSCSSELPTNLNSFLIQQRRWAKGTGQVLRLVHREILSSSWAFREKADALFHMLGYGIATLLTLGFLLTPLWLVVNASWHLQTSALDFTRLLDTAIWLTLFLSFFAVFSSRLAHYGRKITLQKRITEAFGLFLFAPFYMIQIAGSFWRGLIWGGANGDDLVFHRTPKSGTSCGTVPTTRMINWAFSIFSLSQAVLAIRLDLYFVGTILLMQAVAVNMVILHGSQTYNAIKSLIRPIPLQNKDNLVQECFAREVGH